MPDGAMGYAAVACKNLNLETRQFRCYGTRLCRGACHKVNLDIVRDARVLPSTCAYVEMLFGQSEIATDVDWDSVVSESDIGPFRAQKRIIPGSTEWSRRVKK